MNRFLATFLSLLIACGLASEAFSASTGKISGKVVDTNGDPLPGTNVVIVGTTQGASTDGNGDYFILNVTPGTYTLQVSLVGYTTVTQSGVRVNIDLTTPVNFSGQFAMAEEALCLDEITVIAERPVVQADISANVQNLTEQEIERLPITSITDAVELQAGVLTSPLGDLSIRGSDLSEVAYTVDGLSMRDGRDNTPMSTVSVTAIQDVKVQTGGFNKEIPKFDSYEEMATFWDTHSLADYWDQTEPVDFDFAPEARRQYLVGVDREVLARVQRLARTRGVSIESLVNLLLEQRLLEIENPTSNV